MKQKRKGIELKILLLLVLIKLNSFITTIRGDDFYLPLSSSLLARSSEFPQSNDRKTLTTLSLYPRRDPWLLLGTANLLALKHQVLYLDTRLSRPNPSSVTIMYPRQPAKWMDGLLFSRINWPFRGTPCPPIILPPIIRILWLDLLTQQIDTRSPSTPLLLCQKLCVPKSL